MTKHESACAAYVQANAEIKGLTGAIRTQFYLCMRAKAKASGRDPIEMEPCLPAFYKSVMTEIYTQGDEQQDILDCPFCLEANRLIQQRKKARQTLGAAKRQITVLGKQVLKRMQS